VVACAAVPAPSKLFDILPEPILFRALAWQHRLFEPELARMRDFVPRGGTAVDVGAWWGPWTYWLARRASEVVIIEPVPHLAQFLARCAPHTATVKNVALSDKPGEAQLWVPTGGKGSEGRSSLHPPAGVDPVPITVQTARLDDLELGDVRFIKIDVEGHEQAVLKGAEATIARDRPTLLIEIEQGPERSVHEVFADVEALGYAGRFLQGRTWRPLEEFDLEMNQLCHQADIERRGYVGNLLFGRKYVNNFVFDAR
jgi:FkbM family methyltransferase